MDLYTIAKLYQAARMEYTLDGFLNKSEGLERKCLKHLLL